MTEAIELKKQQYQRITELLDLARQRYLDGGGDPNQSSGSLHGEDYLTETEKQELKDDNYILIVELIELTPKNNQDKWDVDSSGPDVFYKISYMANTIFTSKVKKDTLTANWSGISMSVVDMIKTKGSVGPEDLIDATVVKLSKKSTFRIEIYDSDVVKNDLAASVNIDCKDLKIGTNIIKPEHVTNVNNIKIKLIPLSLSKTDLMKELMK